MNLGELNPEVNKYRSLPKFWSTIFFILTIFGVFLSLVKVFMITPGGLTLMQNTYLYLLLAVFVSPIFLLIPTTSKAPRSWIPWYDYVFFFLNLAVFLYLGIRGYEILTKGWLFMTPLHISLVSAAGIVLTLEALRRAGGLSLFIICCIFVTLPLYASHLPGLLEGQGLSLLNTVGYHVLDSGSLIGIPMDIFGRLLCGFMIFGAAIASFGGGQFFLNLSFSFLGTYRGGPAKVAVIASSIFGSLSGSAVSNVITTGSMTIPAMKKTGYPAHYAGAIEACSSTGGMLMPPVMGVTAFIMAEFLRIPYFEVCLAALIPSFLFYLGLFIQVDGYAGRAGIKGLAPFEVPPWRKTFREGWFYIFAIIVLIYFLYLRLEAQAPFLATSLVLLLAMLRKETRIDTQRLAVFIQSTGRLLAELVAILAGVGFVIGSFSITGLGSSLANEVGNWAHGSMGLMLIFGALASYIMGMGLTATACYIFLAIVLAPTLTAMGLNVIAVHLFILYWGILSCITPPVALASFTAANLAGASFFKTGFQAMRMGVILYFVPFFFVLSPALVLQGPFLEILHALSTSILGVFLLGGGLEGYLIWVGKVGFPLRVLSCLAGVLLMFPGWKTDLLGLCIVGAFVIHRFYKRPLLVNIFFH